MVGGYQNTTTYTDDTQNRLIETNSSDGAIVYYTYDANGNMISSNREYLGGYELESIGNTGEEDGDTLGSATVEPEMLDMFNKSILNIQHIY